MNKRDRSEDDNMTTTGSEIIQEDQLLFTSSSSSSTPKKKKRSKRQLNTTYFKQRFLLFSRFNEGIRFDRESWYSVTPEPIARHIAERIERALISHSQTSSSVGTVSAAPAATIIQFALMPSTALVYAVDIDPRKIELARHNASIYGCLHKIQFIVADFFEVIQGDRLPCSLVDACFLSPPWSQSSPDYLTYESFSLAQMTPDGFEIARRVADRVTKNISFLLPRNFDMGELPSLSSIVYQNVGGGEMEKSVEIEENMLYKKKVKTLTAYFGHLVIRKEGDDGGGSGDGGDDGKQEVSALFKTAQVCSPPPIYLADEDEEEEEEEE
ncbi:Trimethylguanosine synthase [Tyrophagus putrescentiae]|nr:Trimethylguanosine synthase [Tyrophagus putrescentiae]